MLVPLDDMITPTPMAPTSNRTWAAIPGFLAAEIAAGESRSGRKRIETAATTLLSSIGVSPENAPLDLDWFDRRFPVGGWDPTLISVSQPTYEDYRNRVRPVIERMCQRALPPARPLVYNDGWDDLCAYLAGLPRFRASAQKKRLIPIRHTLVNAARRAGVRRIDLDQETLRRFYGNAKKGEVGSLRRASALIHDLQSTLPGFDRWLPHPITPLAADRANHYNVPAHFAEEIDAFIEHAARKKFIRAKKLWTYVKKGTRRNFRTALHAAIDALITTGHLARDAGTFRPALADADALLAIVSHTAARVEAGAVSARQASNIMRVLPALLDRNGLCSAQLREDIADVDELSVTPKKAGMPERIKRFCRQVIVDRAFRNRLLLSHARPRLVAQALLDGARAEARRVTENERRAIIRHGTIALFCAIENGGAPLRVENVLEMPYGGPGAWIRPKGEGYLVVVPATRTKNGREIRFEMQPDKHKWCQTVTWFLDHVRPLIIAGPVSTWAPDVTVPAVGASPWLIPMLTDPDRPCPYESFGGWYGRIMRDVVGVPCTPHNHRHAQASLLYHRHPGKIRWIAERLGDTEETVVQCYAWVHAELAMAEGQRMLSDLVDM